MEEENSFQKQVERKLDMRKSVMEKIKQGRVKMKRHYVFLAERLGLEGALAVSLVAGAIIVSLTFYFFEKTKLHKFFSQDFPGLKVILLTIPYEYLVLFVLALGLTIYFARKLDIPCRENMSCNRLSVYFLVFSFIAGGFFISTGFHETLRGLAKSELPRQISVHGRIIEVTSKQVVIKDKEGREVNLVFDNRELAPAKMKYEQGKYLRAVGSRDRKDESYFYVQSVLCCEEE